MTFSGWIFVIKNLNYVKSFFAVFLACKTSESFPWLLKSGSWRVVTTQCNIDMICQSLYIFLLNLKGNCPISYRIQMYLHWTMILTEAVTLPSPFSATHQYKPSSSLLIFFNFRGDNGGKFLALLPDLVHVTLGIGMPVVLQLILTFSPSIDFTVWFSGMSTIPGRSSKRKITIIKNETNGKHHCFAQF